MFKDIRTNYKYTRLTCYVSYFTEAIVVNFLPLLFVTLRGEYGLSLAQITFLITINFAVQLSVDALSVFFVDKIGIRTSYILSHVFAILGIVFLAFLPSVIGNAYVGLLISVILMAIGGGLHEVLISMILEGGNTDNNTTSMSLLHSFYCWGCVIVVIVSTVFFNLFGIENWRILAVIWALVPLLDIIPVSLVPLRTPVPDGEKSASLKDLIKNKFFWIFIICMISAGASEQSISQWTSTLAETSLNLPKNVSDLAGPLTFSICMGLSRTLYGIIGKKIKLEKFMIFSAIACVVSYALIIFSPFPILAIIGCAMSGFSVGIMWPGTLSLSPGFIRNGGTAMYALFALAGDIGCLSGPTIVGLVSSANGENLNSGILAAIVFPALILVFVSILASQIKKRAKK